MPNTRTNAHTNTNTIANKPIGAVIRLKQNELETERIGWCPCKICQPNGFVQCTISADVTFSISQSPFLPLSLSLSHSLQTRAFLSRVVSVPWCTILFIKSKIGFDNRHTKCKHQKRTSRKTFQNITHTERDRHTLISHSHKIQTEQATECTERHTHAQMMTRNLRKYLVQLFFSQAFEMG